MIIGITGRAGTGKSFLTDALTRQFDFWVIDLDKVGHHLLEETDIKERVIHVFGRSILSEDGRIDRSKLGGLVFKDKQTLDSLNKLIHPKMKEWVEQKTQALTKEKPGLIVGALIDEIGLTPLCEKMIVLDVDDETLKQKRKEKADILNYQRSRASYQNEGDLVISHQYDKSMVDIAITYLKKVLAK